MWFHRPVVCGSRSGLAWQKEAVRHVPGSLWAVVWLAATLTDGRSLSLFSSSGYLVPLTHKLPFLSLSPLPHTVLPSPPQMKTFPLVNRGRNSRVEDTTESQKNMSLCGRGILIMGVNMPLKRS